MCNDQENTACVLIKTTEHEQGSGQYRMSNDTKIYLIDQKIHGKYVKVFSGDLTKHMDEREKQMQDNIG